MRYELPKRYRAGKTGANSELRPSLSGATLGSVNTREKAHELLDRLPDSEIETVVDFLSHRQQEMADALVRPGSRAPRIGLGRSTDGRSAAETATEPVARHPA